MPILCTIRGPISKPPGSGSTGTGTPTVGTASTSGTSRANQEPQGGRKIILTRNECGSCIAGANCLRALARLMLRPASTRPYLRMCQTACKPGSVRTRVRDDHSSGTHLAMRLTRPTRTAGRERPCALRRHRPYSVLLPVGFTLPPLLPGARCALAAPFRPCPRAVSRRLRGRCDFCGTFPGVAPAGR
jgi:hypothetical protein